jgi:hypothetical protein
MREEGNILWAVYRVFLFSFSSPAVVDYLLVGMILQRERAGSQLYVQKLYKDFLRGHAAVNNQGSIKLTVT